MEENKKKKKKKNFFFFFFFFFFQIGNFLSGIGKKNILFGIGNGAEFRLQNRVIESPENCPNRDSYFEYPQNMFWLGGKKISC